MTTKQAHNRLSELIGEAQLVAREAQERFGSLTARQLNWKPSHEQWSIGQCLDHLMTVDGLYFPQLKEISAGVKKHTLWERMPLLPDLFGKLLRKAVSPTSLRKMKAPRSFRPSSSALGTQVVESFSAHQQQLIALMNSTAHLDLRRIVITSPVARFVTYSLMDAYEIIVAHEKRHLRQAQRVREREEFPGA